MEGRYIVQSDRQVLVIDDYLSKRELSFARRPDGEIDPRFALEVAIDLLCRETPAPERVEAPSSSLFSSLFTRLHWKRPVLLGGTV